MTSVGLSLRGGEQCKHNSYRAGLIMQHTCMHRLEYPHIYISGEEMVLVREMVLVTRW